MANTLTLGVYRMMKGGTAQSLHDMRKGDLHEILDSASEVSVVKWGNTDDTRPHEFVELIVAVGTSAFIVVVPLAQKIAEKLVEKGIDTATSEAVKWLFHKLSAKKEAGRIERFYITTPDGTRIEYPKTADVVISFRGGKTETVSIKNTQSS